MKTISEMRKNSTKKDFIVDNLMKSNGLYCLVARPKVGKSLLALQLANSIATGTTFLGFRTSPSPVLYISTEMNFSQILDRIDKMNLEFNDDNFRLKEQEINERKLNLIDLQLEFQEFANDLNGRFVIIDMFSGIDMNNGYDLNNYQDMGQYVIPKFRELCKKYNYIFFLYTKFTHKFHLHSLIIAHILIIIKILVISRIYFILDFEVTITGRAPKLFM